MREHNMSTTPSNRGHALIDEITREAIRRAAMAPTYMAALDITGAALIEVAMIAKMEVGHV
ncbi:hypothetical protein VOM14_06070 [Paraburkholderia sp. MPAMCS5]|uniref:hypothetical protein n=1 Tax=Paraburkholderia sp. MPAMCS5 TaxID=3112563 RepID=UPI002E19CFF7|nr:hypothetical protein [Paraburkholderia sp. MPAMCS5]